MSLEQGLLPAQGGEPLAGASFSTESADEAQMAMAASPGPVRPAPPRLGSGQGALDASDARLGAADPAIGLSTSSSLGDLELTPRSSAGGEEVAAPDGSTERCG